MLISLADISAPFKFILLLFGYLELFNINKTIDKMRGNAKFIQITASGMKESHPHDMKITKEAPNYNL